MSWWKGIDLDPALAVKLGMQRAHFRHQFRQQLGLLRAGVVCRQRAACGSSEVRKIRKCCIT